MPDFLWQVCTIWGPQAPVPRRTMTGVSGLTYPEVQKWGLRDDELWNPVPLLCHSDLGCLSLGQKAVALPSTHRQPGERAACFRKVFIEEENLSWNLLSKLLKTMDKGRWLAGLRNSLARGCWFKLILVSMHVSYKAKDGGAVGGDAMCGQLVLSVTSNKLTCFWFLFVCF